MKRIRKTGKVLAIVAATVACLTTGFVSPASAATFTSMTLTPDNPTTAATGVTYAIALSSATATNAKCVRVHFGSTSSFAGLPTGMTFTTPTVTVNSTTFGSPAATGDYVGATDSTGVIPTSVTLTGIKNTTTAASVYYKVDTFTDTGCSSALDSAVGEFAVTDNTVVSVTVDPSFTFTVGNQSSACNGESNFLSGAGTATTVGLGRLAVSSNASGSQLLTISGNSGGGYTVYLRGTQATTNLRSSGAGAHNWSDVSGTYASPAALAATGTENFGYTYKDNVGAGSVTNPGSALFVALDNTNRAVMDANNTASSGTGCVTFDAQTGSSTPAGYYTATVVYTAVPVF